MFPSQSSKIYDLFIQVAVSPPVLPNLQRLYPDRFSVHTPIDRTESLACSVPVCKSQNKQSLSDLLIGFFRYFASYNFKKVMSIRNCNVSWKLHLFYWFVEINCKHLKQIILIINQTFISFNIYDSHTSIISCLVFITTFYYLNEEFVSS